ncbi:Alpha/Beta hydrolase protein [Jimgerdemannia flammicorona]|uniref:Alpha/Beta hydrolase protein n=2 Tax=Jimgerdemannia flammicorona TaxID=994334 RepID=A0A433QEX8_9FUNG|nr:Alpha/Beta hydrolase protein [Jimgerdemannia flammicorona]RUS28181.1 Alpha/Beta hydrolase protein [Jimgerdemannia flammicorona]
MLVLFQNKLIYLPYIPLGARKERLTSQHALSMDIREVTVTARDGTLLRGLVAQKKNDEYSSQNVLVYFQGNAGNMIHRVPLFQLLISSIPNLTIVGIGYRGFGGSDGRPSEKGLQADALSILKYVKTEFPLQSLYLYGHSLGGSVALYLASTEEARNSTQLRGLIVENTYTSIEDMVMALYGKYTPYPYIAKYCLWNKWESNKVISKVHLPILFLSSQKDEIVPKEHMSMLFENATNSSSKTFVKFKHSMHMDMFAKEPRAFITAIRDFTNLK